MTDVPLPDVPVVRCRLIFNDSEGNELGSRFYLKYSGSAPSGDNCVTLATDISSDWGATLKGICNDDFNLIEVDVLDIATDSGLSGQWTGSIAGTSGSGVVPVQCAVVCEFNISRRYRGGKPRMYAPPGGPAYMLDNHHWTGAFTSNITTQFTAFFTAVTGHSIGSMGTLGHVNLSYYKGFTNITNSSGRERAVPKYRPTALHDDVTGYSGKQMMGSQKRRRVSTTP